MSTELRRAPKLERGPDLKGGEGGSQTPPHAMCNYFFILDTFRVTLTVLTYTNKQQLNIPGCHLVNIYHSVLINKINKDTIPHLLTKWWWSNGIDTRSNRTGIFMLKKWKSQEIEYVDTLWRHMFKLDVGNRISYFIMSITKAPDSCIKLTRTVNCFSQMM